MRYKAQLDPPDIPELIPGDANLDGQVRLDDFATLKQNFSAGAFWYQGDFNNDYQIDLADFDMLKENFGRAAPVPEPASAPLLVLGSLFLLALYIRRLIGPLGLEE